MSFNSLVIGNKYSKKDLSEVFDNPNISKIREGIYNVSQSESFFFVDLEKKGKGYIGYPKPEASRRDLP